MDWLAKAGAGPCPEVRTSYGFIMLLSLHGVKISLGLHQANMLVGAWRSGDTRGLSHLSDVLSEVHFDN